MSYNTFCMSVKDTISFSRNKEYPRKLQKWIFYWLLFNHNEIKAKAKPLKINIKKSDKHF